MLIDICVENSAALGQLVDPLWLRTVQQASKRLGRPPRRATVSTPGVCVRTTASELPFTLAWAIWLIDVCGYSYADAAVAMEIDEKQFPDLIREARIELLLRLDAQGWSPSG